MSGVSSIQWALEQLKIELDRDHTLRVLESVKSIGQKGRTVDLTELNHIVQWIMKEGN
jgi:hypothetical protein